MPLWLKSSPNRGGRLVWSDRFWQIILKIHERRWTLNTDRFWSECQPRGNYVNSARARKPHARCGFDFILQPHNKQNIYQNINWIHTSFWFKFRTMQFYREHINWVPFFSYKVFLWTTHFNKKIGYRYCGPEWTFMGWICYCGPTDCKSPHFPKSQKVPGPF